MVDGMFGTAPSTAALFSPSDRVCPSVVSRMMVPPLPIYLQESLRRTNAAFTGIVIL